MTGLSDVTTAHRSHSQAGVPNIITVNPRGCGMAATVGRMGGIGCPLVAVPSACCRACHQMGAVLALAELRYVASWGCPPYPPKF
jgi:hypothetical protein